MFSSAKLTLSDRRNRLSPKTMEALECIKSWMKLSNWSDSELLEQAKREVSFCVWIGVECLTLQTITLDFSFKVYCFFVFRISVC
jgi:hypothetical protein